MATFTVKQTTRSNLIAIHPRLINQRQLVLFDPDNVLLRYCAADAYIDGIWIAYILVYVYLM